MSLVAARLGGAARGAYGGGDGSNGEAARGDEQVGGGGEGGGGGSGLWPHLAPTCTSHLRRLPLAETVQSSCASPMPIHRISDIPSLAIILPHFVCTLPPHTHPNTTHTRPCSSPPQDPGLDLEARQLRDGEYVAVRRFTRILERGPDAKATVDRVVDACGVLINLRTAIIRYRQPRSLDRFYRCWRYRGRLRLRLPAVVAASASPSLASAQGLGERCPRLACSSAPPTSGPAARPPAGPRSRRGTTPSSAAPPTWSATACCWPSHPTCRRVHREGVGRRRRPGQAPR